jgi:cyclophilin family peptidyl-prolyl cis-trans isomerase
VLAQLAADYPEVVRVVYRHFPLPGHDKALIAAQAAEAAGLQGFFWEMENFLYTNFSSWSALSADEFPSWLLENAVELGLDMDQFEVDLTSEAVVSLAQKAQDDGISIGIPGTPFLAINNIPYQGPLDYGSLESIVLANQLKEEQYDDCPPMVIDPFNQYIATIETEKGQIVVELFPDVAPMTVNSFVFLANEGWFDGVSFHRVIPGFMAQGGDPSGSGMGGPGYAFKNESDPDLTFDRQGLVAMANSGPDTNGSQFFITYGPAAHLDGSYTIFGEVRKGMDVVESLTPRDPSQAGELPSGDLIVTISIEER